MTRLIHPVLLAALLAAPAWAADKDAAMLKIAQNAGCMTCHQVDTGAKGPDGLAPIGPPWRDVAAKYKGQKGCRRRPSPTP